MVSGFVMAIDQGTTSSRAIVFDGNQRIAGMGKIEFTQHYPQPGWLEHAPEEIWATCLWACKVAMRKAGIGPADLAGIGISNQRETVVVWDRDTGKPIHNAIVWQDRRTGPFCAELKAQGVEPEIVEKTGLVLDPYFSGSKVRWILDNVPNARQRAEAGGLALGTVDSFLIWRLTGGRVHATDATNASRTMLFNIASQSWDDDLLRLFGIPRSMLPQVLDCGAEFGTTAPEVLGGPVPIRSVAGDQNAAAIGQACFAPGMLKSTYGSSCFALLNTGADRVQSGNRLLTTVLTRLNGRTTYALEGAIFTAGAAVTWLQDGLNLLRDSAESSELARNADPDSQVYMVPAFVGLGAPWWDLDARGAIFGLTRDTRRSELARAALEAVAYQTRDMVDAMRRDWTSANELVLRVDGGMVESDWTMQFLADMLEAPVDRPAVEEVSALGVAWLAGHQAGAWPGAAEFAARWRLDRRFSPKMAAAQRSEKLQGWDNAVRRTLTGTSVG